MPAEPARPALPAMPATAPLRLGTVAAAVLALAGLVSGCSQGTAASSAPGRSASAAPSSPAPVATAQGAWVDQPVTFQAGNVAV